MFARVVWLKSWGAAKPPTFDLSLVARAVRGKCVRHRSNVKVGGFIAPHSFSYTTRANIAHEIAEQIRARIVCTPAEKRWAGVGGVRALTGLSK